MLHRFSHILRVGLHYSLVFWAFISAVIGHDEEEEIRTSTTTLPPESDAIWCPTHKVGNQCPEETFLSFYKCCGHLNKECCFHMRVWVVIMIIVLPMCLVLPATTFLLRRLLCSPEVPRGAPSTADRVRQLAAEDSMNFRRDSDDMVML